MRYEIYSLFCNFIEFKASALIRSRPKFIFCSIYRFLKLIINFDIKRGIFSFIIQCFSKFSLCKRENVCCPMIFIFVLTSLNKNYVYLADWIFLMVLKYCRIFRFPLVLYTYFPLDLLIMLEWTCWNALYSSLKHMLANIPPST